MNRASEEGRVLTRAAAYQKRTLMPRFKQLRAFRVLETRDRAMERSRPRKARAGTPSIGTHAPRSACGLQVCLSRCRHVTSRCRPRRSPLANVDQFLDGGLPLRFLDVVRVFQGNGVARRRVFLCGRWRPRVDEWLLHDFDLVIFAVEGVLDDVGQERLLLVYDNVLYYTLKQAFQTPDDLAELCVAVHLCPSQECLSSAFQDRTDAVACLGIVDRAAGDESPRSFMAFITMICSASPRTATLGL